MTRYRGAPSPLAFSRKRARGSDNRAGRDIIAELKRGPLAQLVEQETLNLLVVGSTPTRPTTSLPASAPRAAGGVGCTLTQGYWKTHSAQGPAPSDPTWNDILPSGPATPFFSSGTTWLGALQKTPAGGNAYWNLAHQYIAAILNQDNGASVPSQVANTISDAQALLSTYTPTQVGALGGSDPVRAQFISDAALLDTYNNGLYSGGPPHCTDNSASP